jgi:hypothetical protein
MKRIRILPIHAGGSIASVGTETGFKLDEVHVQKFLFKASH